MCKEHPMFIRDASAISHLDSSPTATNDTESPSTTNNVEEVTLKNRMTTKGYDFKSQNTLHAAENDRKKKKVSVGKSDEVIDLTIDNHHTATAAKTCRSSDHTSSCCTLSITIGGPAESSRCGYWY
jgi:hypothetical protein